MLLYFPWNVLKCVVVFSFECIQMVSDYTLI